MTAPKILIVRFAAIGDCVMAAHAVTGIRTKFPDAHIVWAVQDRCQDVLDGTRLVNRIEVTDTERWRRQQKNLFIGLGRLRRSLELRKYRFDIGFDLHGQLKTSVCLRVSGARQRLASQAQDPVSRRLNPLMAHPPGKVHEVERSHLCVKELLGTELPDHPIMPPTSGADSFDVVLQTGGGHPAKVLRSETLVALANGLRDAGHSVCLIGGPGDPDPVVDGVQSRVGQLSLRETCGLVARSRMHVGPDTGTGHIAAAYGVPTVSVFGPTDPDLYRPWSRHAVVVHPGEDPNTVDPCEVVAKAHEGLTKRCESSLAD